MINLVVLGDPILHSRSPAIHTAALAAAGLRGTYRARRVDAAGLAAASKEVRAGVLDGANITMPHKRRACGLVDRLTDLATRGRSVNTWYRDDGAVIGDSTDGAGIIHALDHAQVGVEIRPLILGAGGAAAAALLALENRNPEISTRRPERARELIDRTGVRADIVEWGTGGGGRLVINATPLGMQGESLPGNVLAGATALLDMVYGDQPTPAVLEAQDRGLGVADGLEMLVGQAAASFSLWTGHTPDMAVMRSAALKTLKRPPNGAENAE